jgi:AAHS family 4-hydroxybenzoate transporter-like MFS transporter
VSGAGAPAVAPAQPDFEVGALLDRAPVGSAHLRVFALAGAAIVLDGFDLQALGFAAPSLIADWGISRAELAPLFAAGIIGMAIGALLFGHLGDRWGRRRAILVAVLLFALTTLGCAFAASTQQLLALRLLAGIGLGGALPNAAALVSESAPLRWRALLTSVVIVGVPVGGVLGGELAAQLLPLYGWRGVFVAGGLAPLALAVAMALWLSESPRYLLRGGQTARAVPVINRLQSERSFQGGDPIWLREPEATGKASFKRLFEATFLRDTLGLWLLFLANMFSVFCFMNWLPAVLVDLGHDMSAATRLLALFNLGGIAGALAGAWLMRWHGSRTVLASLAGIAAVNAVVMGQADLAVWWNVLVLSMIAGLGINALMVGTYVLSAHVYPTEIRTTGMGFALAVGRAGAVLSSFAGALVAGGADGAGDLFLLVAGAMLLSATATLTIRRHIPVHA